LHLRIHFALCIVLQSIAPSTARADEKPQTPALDQERDELLARITRGDDLDASVRRFGQLLDERDRVIATSQAAVARRDEELQRRRALRSAWSESADGHVAGCVLSPDPAHPLPAIDRYTPPVDWGLVVRKEHTRLLPKNALDEGKPATMYEIAGRKRHYFVHAETMWPREHPLVAEVGDLVLLCVERAGYDLSRPDDRFEEAVGDAPHYPAAWRAPVQRGGIIARIARPPLITEKTRWNPIHVSRNWLYWAVESVVWKLPGDGFVLAAVEVDADLGNGRYRMLSEEADKATWILDVPPTVKHRELMQPGQSVWVIMGHHRFDPALKKLVLTAEDLEERYVFPRP
jgi:hypothetical protein